MNIPYFMIFPFLITTEFRSCFTVAKQAADVCQPDRIRLKICFWWTRRFLLWHDYWRNFLSLFNLHVFLYHEQVWKNAKSTTDILVQRLAFKNLRCCCSSWCFCLNSKLYLLWWKLVVVLEMNIPITTPAWF